VELTPAIEWVMRSAGAAPADLRGIGIGLGPGGFSALRAGMGAAKGLAFALDIPIVGVSTLEAEVYPYRESARRLCALLPAGRRLVSRGTYEGGRGRWRRVEERTSTLEELVGATTAPTLFCGEAAPEHAASLEQALGRRAIVVHSFSPMTRLSGLADLALQRLERGEAGSLEALQPNYLRAPGITVPRPPQAVARGTAPRSAREER
jgi:tRNA threonylcarbamoyladenosine biosynthesis protein TsaB